MLATKSFRPLFVIAAAAVFMLMASTNVEAAPASDALACQVCEEPPECNLRCTGGYCDINYCTCRAYCRKGPIP
ncbi:hypothetical protein BGX26_011202 [Mortierella sp. AD094]|nr:hypothetical protein BGX26_011202 [Mortierella sp. AD094]